MLLQPVYFAFAMELDGVSSNESRVTSSEINGASNSTPNGNTQGQVAETGSVANTASVADAVTSATQNAGEESSSSSDAPGTSETSGTVESTTTGAGNSETGTAGEGVTNDALGDSGSSQDVGVATSTDTGITTGDTGVTTSESGNGADEGAESNATTTDTVNELATSSSPLATESATSTASSTADTATTTDEEIPSDNPVIIAQNPQNKYVFGDGDCTVVAEGEFYCVAAGPMRQPTGDPRVYAEKDREGDREIYYFDGIDVQRVTNNGYDDLAPVFDAQMQRIVWQAMIADRLQIMVYDLETNTTRQITTGRHNSSNPDVVGNTVVWQEWIDTNWEIMKTEVNTDGAPFVIEQLSDNAVNDMFPQLYDGMITWQREQGRSWEVVLYDTVTGTIRTLPKSENTKYENPRFVLLFDSKHDNGDVETVGYNLKSGDMMELGTKANREPFVPASPKDKVPDAPVSSNASSTVTKVAGREDDGGNDPTL
jgi:hypothetical protein